MYIFVTNAQERTNSGHVCEFYRLLWSQRTTLVYSFPSYRQNERIRRQNTLKLFQWAMLSVHQMIKHLSFFIDTKSYEKICYIPHMVASHHWIISQYIYIYIYLYEKCSAINNTNKNMTINQHMNSVLHSHHNMQVSFQLKNIPLGSLCSHRNSLLHN